MTKITNFFKTSWMARAVFLAILCGIVYIHFLQNSFIWDDDYYLTKNPHLKNVDGLKRIWFDILATPQYYPLVFTSFWIEHKFWGLDPLGYHLDNIIIHCINTILLWRILSFLEVKGSWLAAAIFLIHPIQAESVAWISERKNLLSGFFSFLSLYFFFQFYNLDKSSNFNEDQNGKRSWTVYGISLFFFIYALLSKTIACTLPAVILLIYWWKQNCIRRRSFLMMVPYFAIGLGSATLTIWLEKFQVGAMGHEWEFSFVDRFLIAGRVLWFYIGKLVWPHPIIFIYPRWIIDSSIWWQYIYPVTFLLLVFMLWYWRKNIGRGPLTAILFFAGSLFPALGFFNVYPMKYSFVADHFQYLSCIGIIVLFSSGVDKIAGEKRSQAYFLLLAGLLIILGNLTSNQGPVYKNEISLWNDTIKKNPKAWMAYHNLGAALLVENKADEAVSNFKMAIELKPDESDVYFNLGIAFFTLGKTEKAISYYKTTIKLKPDFSEAHYSLATALFSLRKIEEAIPHYHAAIKLTPGYAKAYNNLGAALLVEGKIEEAVANFQMAIGFKPDFADARYNLKMALKKLTIQPVR